MSKRLYRSRKDKVLGGVAGGLANYFDIDPIIARLVFIGASFIWGGGVLIYLLLWILTPKEAPTYINADAQNAQTNDSIENGEKIENHNKRKYGNTAALVLICIGLIGVLKNYIPDFSFHDILPFFFLAIGGYILFSSNKKDLRDRNIEENSL